MKKTLTLLFILFSFGQLYAQEFVEKKTRFRFAQTYVGVDFLYFPDFSGLNRVQDSAGSKTGLPNSFSPRVTIGGLHFWGYADFYVSFPVYNNIFTQSPENGEVSFYSGVETGFHVYPWQLKYNTFRPFLGVSWVLSGFRRTFNKDSKGSMINLHRFPIVAGVTYLNTWGAIDLTFRYIVNPTFEYYINPNEKAEYKAFPLSFSLGYKYIFDTTITREKNQEATEKREQELKESGGLNGISIGIGPSSTFTLRKFQTNLEGRSFLNTRPTATLLPDATLGYHIHNIDSEVRFAYRFINQVQDGFGFEQTFRRHAVSLEFIKFIFDYQGFVPFLGLGVEYNHLSYQEKSTTSFELATSKFGLPIVFGWDIRPVISTKWLLRTTLRYNPLLHLSSAGYRVPFEHFEFNFIQFVYYLGR